jgi:hypothetical protein
MVVLNVVAAFWAAENTEEKKPLGDWEATAVPPGVLTSSIVGVNGAEIEFESLLGGFVEERARRCDIIFPDGETTTLGFDCVAPCFALAFELLVELAGDAGGFASVGVGGVTSVVGASARFGGVAGICVIILFGAVEGRFGVDWVSAPSWIEVGDACNTIVSSSTFDGGRFPPKIAPNPPPLVLGLELSLSPPVLGDVDLLWGENASLSLPTGDALRFIFGVTSMVLACVGVRASSAEVADPFVSVGATDSSVSEAISGEDNVK